MHQLSTLNPTTANPATPPCPRWCVIHDGEFDLCVGRDIHQDFGDRGPQLDVCHDARTTLTRDPDHGDRVGLSINGRDATELDLDQAAAIAHAILAQVATARGRRDDAMKHRSSAMGTSDAPITEGMHVSWYSYRLGTILTGIVECEPFPFRGAPHVRVVQDNTPTRVVWSYTPVSDLTPVTGLQNISDTDATARIPAQRVSHDGRAGMFTDVMSGTDKQRAHEVL